MNSNSARVEIEFAPVFQKYADQQKMSVDSNGTLRDALRVAFASNPRLRGYVLDDDGGVRQHVVIRINQESIADRHGLSDPLKSGDQVFIFQTLSRG